MKICHCGSHMMWCSSVYISDGVTLYIYTCSACGEQLEFQYDTDPTKV